MPATRTALTSFHINQLERRIDNARMTASLASDWDQLHIRSRAMSDRITRETDSLPQIATARHIRAELHREKDTLGLRALRLATAGAMAGWLRNEATEAKARRLDRLFKADQRMAIPGLADMESQLQLAYARRGSDERMDAASGPRRLSTIQE